METSTAPVLSTPAEHILEAPESIGVPPPEFRLSDEQIYVQYEIQRTVDEIRFGKWKRIALQFPDDMLVDAPRVFERLRDGLKAARKTERETRRLKIARKKAEKEDMAVLEDVVDVDMKKPKTDDEESVES